jgi:hypothetical protein
MRLPRYGRGLQLVRIGVVGTLLQLLLAIALVIKSITANTPEDAMDLVAYVKYVQWANLASVGVMLVGSLFAVPDFIAAKMSLGRLVIAAVGFGVAMAALFWSYRAITAFVTAMLDRDFDEMEAAARGLESLPILTIVKDLAYTGGLIAIVRSVRQTAIANDHEGLRATADYVSRLTVGMLAADGAYQWMYGLGSGRGVTSALLGLALGVGVLGYWVYCHLKLLRFLRAASLLVDEPHNLPAAKVVSSASTAPAEAPPPPPKPAPEPRPSAPRMASAPVIAIPTTEPRSAPVPRAETAPGEPPPEGPKFLK